MRAPAPTRLLAIAAAVASAAVPPGPPAGADGPPALYLWRDQAGGVHYTPDPVLIPESRRETQERIDLPREGGSRTALAPDERTPVATSPEEAGPSRSLEAHPDGPLAAERPEPRPVPRAETRARAPDPRPAPPAEGRVRPDAATEPGRAGWAVQLRATPAALDQEPLPEVALQPGERLYHTEVRVGGELWTRLRVGTFSTRSEAQAALDRLARDFPGAWVTPVAATETMPRAEAWAIQLRAVPAAEDPGPQPPLALPPGTRLYWTSSEHEGRAWRRLRLGDFPTLAAAREALALVASEFPEAWIAPAGEAQTGSDPENLNI
jgi:cell division septation protein DedD